MSGNLEAKSFIIVDSKQFIYSAMPFLYGPVLNMVGQALPGYPQLVDALRN